MSNFSIENLLQSKEPNGSRLLKAPNLDPEMIADIEVKVDKLAGNQDSKKSGYLCQRCLNHKTYNKLRGHKSDCPFKDCSCIDCRMICERSKLESQLQGFNAIKNPQSSTKISPTMINDVVDPNSCNKKRVPLCNICRQHGILNRLKGHKKHCTITQHCLCTKCCVVRKKRKLMADQIRLRRKQQKHKQKQAAALADKAQDCKSNSGTNVLLLKRKLEGSNSSVPLNNLTTSNGHPALLTRDQRTSAFQAVIQDKTQLVPCQQYLVPQPARKQPYLAPPAMIGDLPYLSLNATNHKFLLPNVTNTMQCTFPTAKNKQHLPNWANNLPLPMANQRYLVPGDQHNFQPPRLMHWNQSLLQYLHSSNAINSPGIQGCIGLFSGNM